MEPVFKKIHRKYPDWEFRAIAVKIENIEYVIGCSRTKKKEALRWGLEIYRYKDIVKDNQHYHSQNFSEVELPDKYEEIYAKYKTIHNAQQWSKDDYINEN